MSESDRAAASIEIIRIFDEAYPRLFQFQRDGENFATSFELFLRNEDFSFLDVYREIGPGNYATYFPNPSAFDAFRLGREVVNFFSPDREFSRLISIAQVDLALYPPEEAISSVLVGLERKVMAEVWESTGYMRHFVRHINPDDVSDGMSIHRGGLIFYDILAIGLRANGMKAEDAIAFTEEWYKFVDWYRGSQDSQASRENSEAILTASGSSFFLEAIEVLSLLSLSDSNAFLSHEEMRGILLAMFGASQGPDEARLDIRAAMLVLANSDGPVVDNLVLQAAGETFLQVYPEFQGNTPGVSEAEMRSFLDKARNAVQGRGGENDCAPEFRGRGLVTPRII